jgi:hypothetical protein
MIKAEPNIILSDSDIEYSKLVEIAAKWEAVLALLNGEEVSDFMLSFPEINKLDEIIRSGVAYV